MRITDAIVQSGAAESVRKATGSPTAQKDSSSAKAKGDSVSISKKGKDLSKSDASAASVKAHANALPDVREDKVAEAKARIESGYYSSPEFQDKLADKLLGEFGVSE